MQATNDQILRWPQVEAMTGLSRTTTWRLERKGAFPKRIQLSAKAVGWRKSEIEAWIEQLSSVNTDC